MLINIPMKLLVKKWCHEIKKFANVTLLMQNVMNRQQIIFIVTVSAVASCIGTIWDNSGKTR